MRQRHAGRAERVDGGDELDQTARRIQRQSVVVGEGSGAAATVIADRTSVRVHGAQRPQRARRGCWCWQATGVVPLVAKSRDFVAVAANSGRRRGEDILGANGLSDLDLSLVPVPSSKGGKRQTQLLHA